MKMSAVLPAARERRAGQWRARLRGNGLTIAASAFLVCLVLVAILAPLLTSADPILINAVNRLKPPSAQFWFGADTMGRDLFARVVYGARTSLVVGVVAAGASLLLGLVIGLVCGYFPIVDSVLMRVMDGIMSIPSIVFAVALVAITGANLVTVLLAIVLPEFPRVVRLVRGLILSLRNEAYVEAAVSLATPAWRILLGHMLPNTLAPLIVQGSFILASAILTEAVMSFLGVGLPPEVPSWGNIIADGRSYFQLRPGLVFFPGIPLALTVLAINLIGDALRDALDPKLARRG
ncbi:MULTISPECIES: ABC transporter permease [Bradyrhizobium]|jgi:peptide/nickel transport system permease protein|uniref:ABC transporter permease n=1 Tax=Bradyrhizobium arachidis TaxID=858423 RepID=A0AAE7NLW3_9BRAD|nr:MULTISPECIES: ABC transporter permease [Bradyrhizobium]QOZ68324.1 ABC transporter permease [Bradyrhizobium arachidis]SFV02172.1 peptide/nickel transport system permease protein [Bradyrhizobium arachidis]HEV2158046.1 ABC transporter permease [Bradyrhizobium sp.]